MRNIELKGLFCCDLAILDNNRKVSLIGIFDTIYAKKLPIVHPKMTVVGFVDFAESENPEEIIPQLKVVGPDKKVILDIEIPGNKPVDKGAKLVIDIVNLKLTNYGHHSFDFYINGSLLGTTKINVQEKQ